MKKIELLAPAGDLTAALTAFDAGADAVYAGLKKFNARERSENFSLDEMSRLVAYARHNNKKVYVALNTLIKESELPEFASCAKDLALIRPNAVIVQDLGAIHLLRKYYPELELHASTQMGFHNTPGLKVAARLGLKRVILERQVTLDELDLMSSNPPVELEIFVHGALCCCLSGSCLFSSWLGGWSGNRGKCKQPCRRRFHHRKGNGFFFSMADLALLDLVPKIKKMNVTSWKIEGRLRQPDYVKNVVRAYRLLLDAPEKEVKSRLKEAKAILSRSYGRKWSHGFAEKRDFASLTFPERPGVSGRTCGKIVKIAPNGFFAELSANLSCRDRIRIQSASGDDGPALTITKMKVEGESGFKAKKGQNCFIFANKEVMPGDFLYKIGEAYDSLDKRIENLYPAKTILDLKIELTKEILRISISNLESRRTWELKLDLVPAEKFSIDAGVLNAEFLRLKSKLFDIGHIVSRIKGEWFMPASVLKSIRIEFQKWLDDEVSHDEIHKNIESRRVRFLRDYGKLVANLAKRRKKTAFLNKHIKRSPISGMKTARCISDVHSRRVELVLPMYLSESKVKELKEQIKDAYENGTRDFRVTSLYAAELLRKYDDISWNSSFPLPACNSLAVIELRSLGCVQTQAWLELEEDELRAMSKKSSLPLELYTFGRPPLLSTRAKLGTLGDISGSRGAKFRIVLDANTDLCQVFAEKALSLPTIEGFSEFHDFTNCHPREKSISTFNFKHELV